MDEDILQDIKTEDWPQLKDLFLENWPHHIHSYLFLEHWINLKERDPKLKIDICCPDGDWSDGTFVAIITEKTYSLAFGTLDKSANRLVGALKKTNRINWNNAPYNYTIHEEIEEPCLKALRNIQPIDYEVTNQCLWIPKEKALKLEIDLPPGYQIRFLEPHHASIIKTHWRYPCSGAEQYLMNLIKYSDGFGVFEISTGNLCSWLMINEYGVYGVLHTVDEYRRKRLASQVVKHMAIYRAKMGMDSITNVVVKNYQSERLFYGLGFEKVHHVKWVQFKK